MFIRLDKTSQATVEAEWWRNTFTECQRPTHLRRADMFQSLRELQPQNFKLYVWGTTYSLYIQIGCTSSVRTELKKADFAGIQGKDSRTVLAPL